MDGAEIHRRLRERFGNAIGAELKLADWTVCEVEAKSVADVCRYLRDEPGLHFDCLSNLSAVDRKAADQIEVFYHLFSYELDHRLVLRAATPRPDPVVPTVSHLWPIANWLNPRQYSALSLSL